MQINIWHRRALAFGAVIAVVGAACARAQIESVADSGAFSVGAYGGWQYVLHNVTIPGIPGYPTCAPGFENGSGSGFAAAAVGEYRFSDMLALQFRLGYSSAKAKMAVQEYIGNVLDGGQVVQALTEHTIEPQRGIIDLEPRVVVKPLSIPLGINVGLRWGIVASATFEQKETILSPTNIKFYGGLVRNRFVDDLPNAVSLEMAITGGLSYDFRVSEGVTVSPEVIYHVPLTKVMIDSNWNEHAVRAGVTIRFDLNKEERIDTFNITPALTATVSATKLDSLRNEGSMASMRVEEFVSPQLRPLLNYVFFDDASSDLPARYTRLTPSQAARFSTNSLQNLDVLPTYYHLLNVIGWRLRQNAGATLSLVGCTSDQGAEKGRTDLARARAEQVRDYLRDVWAIPTDRMTIDARNLPEKPSSSSPDGMAENRRVEIKSNVPEILEPIFMIDTVLTTEPIAVRFSPEVSSEAGVESWRLVASQAGQELKTFSGVGTVPAAIEWDLQSERESIPRGSEPVQFHLEVSDLAHQSVVTPVGTFGVEQVTVKKKREEGMQDKEINRFSLILFEYGKSEISDANRRIVDFIRARIEPGAKVTVTGHTDRAGDAGVNQRLSEERARSTARALNFPGATYKGLGESELLHDNTFPEGRFYCRVVNVVVETTVRR